MSRPRSPARRSRAIFARLDDGDSLRRALDAPEPRPVAERLAAPGLHLIAEIKRASPSAGRIAAGDDDIVARARAYEAGGAAAISVLCEPHWFGGSLEDLARVRAAVSVPVLAKEFVVDPRQLDLLRAAGADLVLLLAVLHPRARLAGLVDRALDLGLEPLVEAHDARELDAALATRARLIGLNNRDLRTLGGRSRSAACGSGRWSPVTGSSSPNRAFANRPRSPTGGPPGSTPRSSARRSSGLPIPRRRLARSSPPAGHPTTSSRSRAGRS